MIITIALLISFLSLKLYDNYIRRNYGIQESYSDSYYKLEKKKRWYFVVSLWGAGLPVSFAAVYNELNILMFLAGGLICLTGVSPAFKNEKKERIAHMIGAVGGYSLATLSMILEYDGLNYMIVSGVILLSIIFRPTSIGKSTATYPTWIAEEWGSYIILFGLYINNL